MDIPRTLHGTAAFLYLATIPKHTLVGLHNIRPAVANIPSSYKVREVITPTWLHCNLFLAMSALLSIRWSRLDRGSLISSEERAIVLMQCVAGAVVGWEYFRNKMYAGLGILWAAPLASAAALLWPSPQ